MKIVVEVKAPGVLFALKVLGVNKGMLPVKYVFLLQIVLWKLNVIELL